MTGLECYALVYSAATDDACRGHRQHTHDYICDVLQKWLRDNLESKVTLHLKTLLAHGKPLSQALSANRSIRKWIKTGFSFMPKTFMPKASECFEVVTRNTLNEVYERVRPLLQQFGPSEAVVEFFE